MPLARMAKEKAVHNENVPFSRPERHFSPCLLRGWENYDTIILRPVAAIMMMKMEGSYVLF